MISRRVVSPNPVSPVQAPLLRQYPDDGGGYRPPTSPAPSPVTTPPTSGGGSGAPSAPVPGPGPILGTVPVFLESASGGAGEAGFIVQQRGSGPAAELVGMAAQSGLERGMFLIVAAVLAFMVIRKG